MPFLVGYNRRFAPVYRRAKELLADRPATLATFQKTRRERFYRASLDNLIHMVDLARFYFGEPDDVTAVATYDDPFWEENLSATLRFPRGRIATVIGNRSSGIWSERVDLYGAGQTITVNAPGEIVVATEDIEHVERRSPAASGYDDPVDALGFTAQTEHFLTAVRRRGTITENTAASALATQELMERILAAAGLPVDDAAVRELPFVRRDHAERGVV
ncbi:Gfo/Idh/MocA family oxidoreductase [Kribbella sp. NPDC026596]|uniref:Gfo/Idh/MocA family protein n=1 Tax=Kribbella sp. NPDC026596 TaxID=3155122 RepID=UPI0033CD05BC